MKVFLLGYHWETELYFFWYLNDCVENINLICELFTVPFLVTLYHEIAWSCRHNNAIEVKNVECRTGKGFDADNRSRSSVASGFFDKCCKLHTIP